MLNFLKSSYNHIKDHKKEHKNQKVTETNWSFRQAEKKMETVVNKDLATINSHQHKAKHDTIDLYADPKVNARDLTNPEKTLDDMVGLSSVKTNLKQFINDALYKKCAYRHGQQSKPSAMNLVFEGNPGTGKTAVARLFGKILHDKGVIPKSHVEECSAGDFLSNMVGGDTRNIRRIVSRAIGGVLFIDEAYDLMPRGDGNLAASKNDDIAELIREIENNRGKLVVILAGYTKPMEHMLTTANPGFRSRFNYTIHFPDYTIPELFEIFKVHAELRHCIIEKSNYPLVYAELKHFIPYAKKNKDHGNARTVRNVIEKIISCRNNRNGGMMNLMSLKKMNLATSADIRHGFMDATKSDTLYGKSKSNNYVHFIYTTKYVSDKNHKPYFYDYVLSGKSPIAVMHKNNKLLKSCPKLLYMTHINVAVTDEKSLDSLIKTKPDIVKKHNIKNISTFIKLIDSSSKSALHGHSVNTNQTHNMHVSSSKSNADVDSSTIKSHK